MDDNINNIYDDKLNLLSNDVFLYALMQCMHNIHLVEFANLVSVSDNYCF